MRAKKKKKRKMMKILKMKRVIIVMMVIIIWYVCSHCISSLSLSLHVNAILLLWKWGCFEEKDFILVVWYENRWDFNSIHHHYLQTRDFDDDEDDFNMADDNDGEDPRFTIYFFDFALPYLFYYDFSIKCYSTLQMSPCFSWSTCLNDIWWLEFCRYRKIYLYFDYKNVHYASLGATFV